MVNYFDISQFIQDFSYSCSKSQIKKFNKGETILHILLIVINYVF